MIRKAVIGFYGGVFERDGTLLPNCSGERFHIRTILMLWLNCMADAGPVHLYRPLLSLKQDQRAANLSNIAISRNEHEPGF